MHCNLRPPEPRSFSVLITTPMPSMKSLNLSAAVYSILTVESLCYAVTAFVTYLHNKQYNKEANELLFQSSAILLHFQTRAAQSWVIRKWCCKRRQIPHFLTPVKSRKGVGEISLPSVEDLPMTKPPKYIWRPSTVRLLSIVDWSKQERRKKERW